MSLKLIKCSNFRSQSVYSKTSSTPGGGPLVAAQSLLLRPPAHPQHALTHNQNAHNAQRDPAYGVTPNGVRPGPAGECFYFIKYCLPRKYKAPRTRLIKIFSTSHLKHDPLGLRSRIQIESMTQ